jgi:hypothetical protein
MSDFSKVRVKKITLTTDASGDLTTTKDIGMKIDKIFIDIGTLANTTDITITDNDSGEQVLALSNATADSVDYPRRQVDDNAGSAIASQYDRYSVGTIKIVVAQGGDTKTGYAYIYG